LSVLIAEYNGVRYAFPRGSIKDIPIEVYDYVKASGHVHSRELMPDIESYEKEIMELKNKISELEKSNITITEKEVKDVRKTSKKK